MKVLMLASRMSMGFGVSVVIAQLCKLLARVEVSVTVGTMETDDFFSADCHIVKMDADPNAIGKYIVDHDIDCVIAHTTPYFELLPKISVKVVKWAWEHGDPTPSLFPGETEVRTQIIVNKLRYVYPNVDRVIAISNFIRQDIGWPEANLIPNGCDHVQKKAPKLNTSQPLKVGTLMRLGKGERYYKGGDLFIQLAKQFLITDTMQFSVMGRGRAVDAEEFSEAGIAVYLNASDAERDAYLEDLDIFLSLSLWEGFNLPLVEAQISGKLAIALDTGAHPEVTPFIMTGIREIAGLLESLEEDRSLLMQYSEKAQDYCATQYTWGKSARLAVEWLKVDCKTP